MMLTLFFKRNNRAEIANLLTRYFTGENKKFFLR